MTIDLHSGVKVYDLVLGSIAVTKPGMRSPGTRGTRFLTAVASRGAGPGTMTAVAHIATCWRRPP